MRCSSRQLAEGCSSLTLTPDNQQKEINEAVMRFIRSLMTAASTSCCCNDILSRSFVVVKDIAVSFVCLVWRWSCNYQPHAYESANAAWTRY